MLCREVILSTLTRGNMNVLHQYRVAQVTENLVNSVLIEPFFPVFLSFIMIGQISSLYIIITSWSHVSAGLMLLFVLLVVDFFSIIHMFLNSLSYSHVASARLIKTVKRSKKWGNMGCRKFLSLCPPLKVGIGDGKFYDKLTSLTIWQFCLDRVINLLIIKWIWGEMLPKIHISVHTEISLESNVKG